MPFPLCPDDRHLSDSSCSAADLQQPLLPPLPSPRPCRRREGTGPELFPPGRLSRNLRPSSPGGSGVGVHQRAFAVQPGHTKASLEAGGGSGGGSRAFPTQATGNFEIARGLPGRPGFLRGASEVLHPNLGCARAASPRPLQPAPRARGCAPRTPPSCPPDSGPPRTPTVPRWAGGAPGPCIIRGLNRPAARAGRRGAGGGS